MSTSSTSKMSKRVQEFVDFEQALTGGKGETHVKPIASKCELQVDQTGGPSRRSAPERPTRVASRYHRQSSTVECVQHREGWCATHDGRRPNEAESNVPTLCNRFVVCPMGFEKMEPTCLACVAVLVARARKTIDGGR